MVAACSGTDAPPQGVVCPEKPALTALGAGDLVSGFATLTPGDDLSLELAFNGAHTAMISARFTDFASDPGAAVDVTVALRAGDAVVGGAIERLVPTTVDGDEVEFVGIRTLLVSDVAPLRGQPVDLEVKATDACGRTIVGSVGVVLTY